MSAHSTKREAILKAARDLILEQRLASISVDAVTEASGASKPTVERHFPTKEALLEAVLRPAAERLDGALEFQSTGDSRQDLERVAHALTTMALAARDGIDTPKPERAADIFFG